MMHLVVQIDIIMEKWWLEMVGMCGELKTQILLLSMLLNGIVSLSEPSSADQKIYPNPFSEYLTIPLDGELEILDLTGRKILGTSVTAGKFNTTFLPQGMYLIRFTNDQSMVKTELFFCSGTE